MKICASRAVGGGGALFRVLHALPKAAPNPVRGPRGVDGSGAPGRRAPLAPRRAAGGTPELAVAAEQAEAARPRPRGSMI
jgi:hypothetical protein